MKTEMHREPSHPGTVLREIIEETKGLTQEKLARELGVSFVTISMIVNGRRAVTAPVAVRLAKRFETSAQFWLNMQTALDIWRAERALADHVGADT